MRKKTISILSNYHIIALLTACCLLPLFSFSQDMFSLMESFLWRAQEIPGWSWIQVSRTFEKGKKEALTAETCYFHKKSNGSYMRCDGEGMHMETISEGEILLQVDKESQTIALSKINADSVWLNTKNSFLKFKEISETVAERRMGSEKIFTLLPKKEYQTMYDSIVYRWEEKQLKKMEIYPAKQFQSLIASNDEYGENSNEKQPSYLDIHWEIIYEQLDSLPVTAGKIENYVVKKPDGTYEMTEQYKNYSLYY